MVPLIFARYATELNQAMLAHAMSIGTSRPVTLEQADAMNLPFADGRLDAFVCQFGAVSFSGQGSGLRRIAADCWDCILSSDTLTPRKRGTRGLHLE